jgi:hypothetical protein
MACSRGDVSVGSISDAFNLQLHKQNAELQSGGQEGAAPRTCAEVLGYHISLSEFAVCTHPGRYGRGPPVTELCERGGGVCPQPDSSSTGLSVPSWKLPAAASGTLGGDMPG